MINHETSPRVCVHGRANSVGTIPAAGAVAVATTPAQSEYTLGIHCVVLLASYTLTHITSHAYQTIGQYVVLAPASTVR